MKGKDKPSVKEMEALRTACPSITQLDNKIAKEKETKIRNIENIFDKSKARKNTK